MSEWTFITNHAQVLLAIAEDPSQTVTELAERAAITERSTFRILADLHRAGYIRRSKNGRRNRYELNDEMAAQDPMIDGLPIAELISLLHRRARARHPTGRSQ
jgi:predicted transcriptional regulator